MTDLLVHPAQSPHADGTFLELTPARAGWEHVGFEAVALRAGRECRRATGAREVCVVVIQGVVTVSSGLGRWRELGGRADPWSGEPDAAYLPPGVEFALSGEGEVGLCWAPAPGGGAAGRVLPGAEITVETRGRGSMQRTVKPILMGEREAESLLVCEVLTPAGHWSSYPPHKHDVDAPPDQTLLEETYYHRLDPPQGFGLQRVYSDDRSLDQALAFGDRDCVLVPRGYHTVSAPPGYRLYYLNVMAGPVRSWAIVNDPDHEWLM